MPKNSVWSTDNGAVTGLSVFFNLAPLSPLLVTSVMNNGHRPLLTLTTGEVENADLLSSGAVLIIAPKAYVNFCLNPTLTAEPSPDFSADLR